jgi:TRAP-type C4-dicarboxylate transport system substrate-binding protein
MSGGNRQSTQWPTDRGRGEDIGGQEDMAFRVDRPGCARQGVVSRVWLLAALFAAALAAPGIATARDFRAADTQAEDYPTVQPLMFMNRLVAERSSGRHRILVFHSRQLGEEKETIEQTRVGAIDLNRTNVAPIGSFVPEANVLALPFLFRSIDHLHRVLERIRLVP